MNDRVPPTIDRVLRRVFEEPRDREVRERLARITKRIEENRERAEREWRDN